MKDSLIVAREILGACQKSMSGSEGWQIAMMVVAFLVFIHMMFSVASWRLGK